MAFNMTPEEIWALILRCLKFLARLPVAGLIIVAALCAALVVGMVLYRTTEFLWKHWLAHPWGSGS